MNDLMTGADDSGELRQGALSLGLELSDQQLQKLLTYRDLIRHWNRHFNLVSKADIPHLISRHLLDSLAIQPFIIGEFIVDIGSGAGLPGIPLAIVNPHKSFTLIDSNGKKTRFLFQVKTALELDNVTVENCRVEHYQSPRQIDIVTCRAFSELPAIIDKTRGLFQPHTLLLAMKGRLPEKELSLIPDDFEVVATEKLEIPGTGSERHLLVVKSKG